MELLEQHLKSRRKILEYFGYQEQWRILPIDDRCEYFWILNGEGPGTVILAKTEKDLTGEEENYYEFAIYTQSQLPRWVYRDADFTMIVVDTRQDENQFLMIFDNSKERTRERIMSS
jgi:hypothetical protein